MKNEKREIKCTIKIGDKIISEKHSLPERIKPELTDKEKVKLFDKIQDIIGEEYFKQIHHENDLINLNKKNGINELNTVESGRIIEAQNFSDFLSRLKKLVMIQDEAPLISFENENIEDTKAEIKRRSDVRKENLKIKKRNEKLPTEQQKPYLLQLSRNQYERTPKRLLIDKAFECILEQAKISEDGKVHFYPSEFLPKACREMYNKYCSGAIDPPYVDFQSFINAVKKRCTRDGLLSAK